MTHCKFARVTGYLPLANDIGFALPILDSDFEKGPLVQEVDELDDRVRGFKRLECNAEQSHALDIRRSVRLGELQCYIFVPAKGEIWCGDLPELEPLLREFAESRPDDVNVRLQIFDLIGTQKERGDARFQVESSIARTLGPRAQRLFRNAALRADLWRLLIEYAPNKKEAQKVLRSRSQLGAWIESNGKIRLDLTSLGEAGARWIDQNKLLASLSAVNACSGQLTDRHPG